MSRQLFGTDGIRGRANLYPMTPEIAMKVGKAIAYRIKDAKNPRVVIGKDTRLSGYMIETALTAGIVSMGADVYLVGPMPTPAIALLTKSLNANKGIVISASHNPSEDNGIKLFDSEGFKLPDSIEEEIEELILTDKLENEDIRACNGHKIGKAFRIEEARGRYIEFAKSTVMDFSLQGMKIVLDCANGAAYYVAPKVFEELGADVIVLNDKPDGLNINKDCGALHPEIASKIVQMENADIGITLDGDADRLIVCDEKGEVLSGDYILAFCALEMMKNKELKKNTLVVTDYSNLGVDETMKRAGCAVSRTPCGDRYIIEEMRKNDYNIGGEESGHIIFSDHTTTGDGIISALQLLKFLKISRLKASDMKRVMKRYHQVMLNIEVDEKRPIEEMPEVKKKIEEVESTLGSEGRTHIRYSGTQDLCRVMVEGKDKEKIASLAEEIAEEIKKEVGKG